MKKILIIGGGFAGLSAAGILCRPGLNLDITLIDRKETSDFLPMLPDIIGRGINPGFLAFNLRDASSRLGFKFINKEVGSVSAERREVYASEEKLSYDYLIIASGSETNFYGNDNIKKNAYKLDEVEDVKKITDALKQDRFDNFIISGGGYTGVEAATNLRLFLNKNRKKAAVAIVERAPSILGPLPAWMKEYVLGNLKRAEIGVFPDTSIEKIENDKAFLSNGAVFNRTLVIWAAGVRTAGFIQDLKTEKNPQGRIKVDGCLRLNDNCFVAGDAAYFSYGGSFLRMAVQFALAQGECAAGNIINSIKGVKLREYRPLDLGYIIPMANNRSCGRVMGLNLKGRFPTMLHFTMCIYRSFGARNKTGIIGNLIRR